MPRVATPWLLQVGIVVEQGKLLWKEGLFWCKLPRIEERDYFDTELLARLATRCIFCFPFACCCAWSLPLIFFFKLFSFFIVQYLKITNGLCWKIGVQKALFMQAPYLSRHHLSQFSMGFLSYFSNSFDFFAHLGLLFLFLIFLIVRSIARNSFRVIYISTNSWLSRCEVVWGGLSLLPSPSSTAVIGFWNFEKFLHRVFVKLLCGTLPVILYGHRIFLCSKHLSAAFHHGIRWNQTANWKGLKNVSGFLLSD